MKNKHPKRARALKMQTPKERKLSPFDSKQWIEHKEANHKKQNLQGWKVKKVKKPFVSKRSSVPFIHLNQ